MKNRCILNVGAVADGDDVVVATNDAVEPDTRAVAENDGADHDSVVGDIEIAVRPYMAVAKGIDHGFEVHSYGTAQSGPIRE